MRHPDLFFGAPLESAIIDLANPHILSGQILCAAAELPMTGENIAVLARTQVLAMLPSGRNAHLKDTAGLVYSGAGGHRNWYDGKYIPGFLPGALQWPDPGDPRPHPGLPGSPHGAVLLHQGDQYLVDSMDTGRGSSG